MDISVIIVNWNTQKLLLACLATVYKTIKGLTFEVWLVDNASTDGSVEAALNQFPHIKVIQNPKNRGFAAANNAALKKMAGRYALLLNTDAFLTDGAVQKLYEFMELSRWTGMACGQLLNTDGSKQNSVSGFPSLFALLTHKSLPKLLSPKKYPDKKSTDLHPTQVDACIGACVLLRKSALREVGCFDEAFFFFMEETDLAFRMKQSGWRIFFVPCAEIYHAQGKTVGDNAHARIMFYTSRYRFFKKWHPRSYFVIYPVVFTRLIVDALLSLGACIFSLGLNARLNKKFVVYLKLIQWHLHGCP